MVQNITKEKGVTQIVKITLGDKKRKKGKKKVARKRKSENEPRTLGSIPTQGPYIPPIIIPNRAAPLVDSTTQLTQLINPLTQRLTTIDQQIQQMREASEVPVKEQGRPKKPIVKTSNPLMEEAEAKSAESDLFPNLTKNELQTLAKKLDLQNYSKLSKADLINTIGSEYLTNYSIYRQEITTRFSRKNTLESIIDSFISKSSSSSS